MGPLSGKSQGDDSQSLKGLWSRLSLALKRPWLESRAERAEIQMTEHR